MNDAVVCLWDELSERQRDAVMQQFPAVAAWRHVPRARASSVAVMCIHDTPVVAVAVTHDRITVAPAHVDVAVVRAMHCVVPAAHGDVVETLMHQALSLLAEGIGVLVVRGDVTSWAPFGFAPISYQATITQRAAPPLAVPDVATWTIPSPAEWRVIQSMALRQSRHHIACFDTAMLPQRPWLLLHGRDGQLRAAADVMMTDSSAAVVAAVASDDGAAYELIQQLWYGALLPHKPALMLSPNHPFAHAAVAQYGVLQMHAAEAHSLLAGVIDLPTMLHALVPAFEARIRQSEYATWHGGVRVEISDERAMIMVEHGRVQIIDGTREAAVRIKQVDVAALAQLLFGYRSVALLRRHGLLFCDDTELPLCEVLFPYCAPVLVLE